MVMALVVRLSYADAPAHAALRERLLACLEQSGFTGPPPADTASVRERRAKRGQRPTLKRVRLRRSKLRHLG